MVDKTRQCLFVHIPKTAGKSIQRFLGLPWQNHKDLGRYADELGPGRFSSLFKVAVVRNPWDRMVSDYVFQSSKRGDRSVALHVRDERGCKRGFGSWLEKVLTEPWAYPPEAWGGEVSRGVHRWSPQVEWLKVGGEMAVDRVLRFENLAAEFAELTWRLGWGEQELPCRNWRFHWPYAWYYDAESRRRVGEFFGEDVEVFGYRFESGWGVSWNGMRRRLAGRWRGLGWGGRRNACREDGHR